jgi:hypothetical protein
MGLSELRKTIRDRQRMEEQQSQLDDSPAMQQLINKCYNSFFYHWGNTARHITNPNSPCNCFNKIIGMPKKGGKEYPLFDYEHAIFRALTEPAFINTRKATDEEYKKFEQMQVDAELQSKTKHGSVGNSFAKFLKDRENTLIWPQKVKHIAVLKATGLGISELCIRFLAWLCLRNNDLQGSQIVIFTGPRLELAVTLVSRLKDLFRNHGITFTDKETVCNLNGVRIEAFPSHHADSARGLSNISAILVDEFSFIPNRETDNIMDIMLRNVPKSNPYLIAISTPRQQGDAMYKLLNDTPYEGSPFKWLRLDWTYGLGKIFSQEEIDKIKNSRSFEREYNLKFSGLEGNLLSETAIQRCISTGEKLAETAPIDDWSIQTQYVMSIDIGWSTSATAIMVSRFVNGKVQIVYSKEFGN